MDTGESPTGTDLVGDGANTADTVVQPELFVLLISAIGTPVNEVQTDLEAAFRAVGYVPKSVRISELLDATAPTARPADTCPTEWLILDPPIDCVRWAAWESENALLTWENATCLRSA